MRLVATFNGSGSDYFEKNLANSLYSLLTQLLLSIHYALQNDSYIVYRDILYWMIETTLLCQIHPWYKSMNSNLCFLLSLFFCCFRFFYSFRVILQRKSLLKMNLLTSYSDWMLLFFSSLIAEFGVIYIYLLQLWRTQLTAQMYIQPSILLDISFWCCR